ncbi:MAG: alpha/beta fold hydrolase [Deltaproteobacteria bacterium]|nr:alpha/beta fold hydrolase [Deltaproteobacteria bacterium]
MTSSMRGLLFFLALPWMAGCVTFHAGAMPGEPRDATYAQIRGVRMRYRDEGPPDAPAIVMIHGFASSLETWLAVTPSLRDRYRVLSLDLKGFGWTDRPEGDYSPEAQARGVLALMDERGIDRAAIVAHSYGSSVALQMALLAPQRVTRLSLYDAWVYSSQLPVFFHLARAESVGEAMFATWYGERAEDRMALAFYDQRYVTMELIDAVDAALQRPGTYAAALASVRAMHYERIESRYREVEQPVLLQWGREDRVTPISVGERLLRDLPDAELVEHPRCGHFPMIEAIDASNHRLVEFLDAGLANGRWSEATSGGDVPSDSVGVSTAVTPDAPSGDVPSDEAAQ